MEENTSVKIGHVGEGAHKDTCANRVFFLEFGALIVASQLLRVYSVFLHNVGNLQAVFE